MSETLGENLERDATDAMSEHYIARINRLTDEANGLRGKLAALSAENAELGKRYDVLAKTVTDRMAELEDETAEAVECRRVAWENLERQKAVMLRLLDEAERVVLSDTGIRYARLHDAVNEVRAFIGLGRLTEATAAYPIRISRREFMDLPIETRRKIMARMTDAYMDASEAESQNA